LTSCGALSALDGFVRAIWNAAGLVLRKTGLGGVLATCMRLHNPAAIARFGLVHRREPRSTSGQRDYSRFASGTTGAERRPTITPYTAMSLNTITEGTILDTIRTTSSRAAGAKTSVTASQPRFRSNRTGPVEPRLRVRPTRRRGGTLRLL
jgi:hypothetical protein